MLDLVPPREREGITEGSSRLAEHIRRNCAGLNAWVAELTGGWIDLKMLVPLAFVGIAAAQLFASGGLSGASPYLLLYVAFDTYVKFHELFPARRAAEAAVAA